MTEENTMNTPLTEKYYISTILITNGGYETLTNYCFIASNVEEAKKIIIKGFNIGGEDLEEKAELYRLNEITEEGFKIISRYI